MRKLTIIAALVLTGCGGLSTEEYDKRTGRVVFNSGHAIEADKLAIKEHPKDPAVYRRLAKDLRTFADDLDAVGTPPTQITARHHRIVANIRRGADRFDEAADALEHGDIETFQHKADDALKVINGAAGETFGGAGQ